MYNQKSYFLLVGYGIATIYSSLYRTFFLWIIEKTLKNVYMTTDSLIEKYWSISIKFKIHNVQLIAKIKVKQQSLK